MLLVFFLSFLCLYDFIININGLSWYSTDTDFVQRSNLIKIRKYSFSIPSIFSGVV